MSAEDILFQPFTLNKLTVDGRVCKTATSETMASEDGFVTDELLAFYEPIVKAGTPRIITGNLYIGNEGKSTYRMGGADAPDKVPGLKRWADLVHKHGGCGFCWTSTGPRGNKQGRIIPSSPRSEGPTPSRPGSI